MELTIQLYFQLVPVEPTLDTILRNEGREEVVLHVVLGLLEVVIAYISLNSGFLFDVAHQCLDALHSCAKPCWVRPNPCLDLST